MVELGTNEVPIRVPFCDSVTQTCGTDRKLKVLAVSNQGKMTLLEIAQSPTHICECVRVCVCLLEALLGCGSKPRNKLDVGFDSWQKWEVVVGTNSVEKKEKEDHEKHVHQSNSFDVVLIKP